MALRVSQGSRKRKIRVQFQKVIKLLFFFPHKLPAVDVVLLYLSFTVWMHSSHPYSTPRLPVVLWAAVWGTSVTIVYHASGTVQGFIKPQSREIWTNQICANMPQSTSISFFFISCFLCLISQYSCFHSNTISFSITMLQKELWCTWENAKLDCTSETTLLL